MNAFKCMLTGLCISITSLYGQSLQSEVISCLGEQPSNGTVNLSYSCGEAFAESTIESLNMYSGFQQGVSGTVTSVTHPSDQSSIWSVFPNPGEGIFTVSLLESTARNGVSNFEIFDASGRLLMQIRNADPVFTIDLTKYATGLYYLRIRREYDVLSIPLVKSHI